MTGEGQQGIAQHVGSEQDAQALMSGPLYGAVQCSSVIIAFASHGLPPPITTVPVVALGVLDFVMES